MKLARKQRKARLEMLPLMDVVFLILIFLVYAMMVMAVHNGMPVNLPSSSTVQAQTTKALALSIQADGQIWLEKQSASLESLPLDIEKLLQARGISSDNEPEIQVFADGQLPYQKLFNVLDVLKAAGLKKISLQAQKGS